MQGRQEEAREAGMQGRQEDAGDARVARDEGDAGGDTGSTRRQGRQGDAFANAL